MTIKPKIKVRKKIKAVEFNNAERFAVVRKPAKDKRHYCNFKVLHTDRSAAEAEAVRMANEKNGQFYVIEIQTITVGGLNSAKGSQAAATTKTKGLE